MYSFGNFTLTIGDEVYRARSTAVGVVEDFFAEDPPGAPAVCPEEAFRSSVMNIVDRAEVVRIVGDFLETVKARGGLYDGKVWADPDDPSIIHFEVPAPRYPPFWEFEAVLAFPGMMPDCVKRTRRSRRRWRGKAKSWMGELYNLVR